MYVSSTAEPACERSSAVRRSESAARLNLDVAKDGDREEGAALLDIGALSTGELAVLVASHRIAQPAR